MDFLANLCTPAQVFIVVETIMMGMKLAFPNKTYSVLFRVKAFFIVFIMILGWAYIINYFCDPNDNYYVSWFLVAVPIIIGMVRISK